MFDRLYAERRKRTTPPRQDARNAGAAPARHRTRPELTFHEREYHWPWPLPSTAPPSDPPPGTPCDDDAIPVPTADVLRCAAFHRAHQPVDPDVREQYAAAFLHATSVERLTMAVCNRRVWVHELKPLSRSDFNRNHASALAFPTTDRRYVDGCMT